MGTSAKEFFQQIRSVEKQIDVKCEQLERLKSLATRVTAAISQVSSRPSGVSQSMENSVDKFIALQDELGADINKFTEMRKEAYGILRKMTNEKQRICLESRYLLGKTWEAIAADIDMSYQGVCKLHGRALQSAEEIMRAR